MMRIRDIQVRAGFRQSKNPERDLFIYQQAIAGVDVATIAATHSLSKTRVRQIIGFGRRNGGRDRYEIRVLFTTPERTSHQWCTLAVDRIWGHKRSPFEHLPIVVALIPDVGDPCRTYVDDVDDANALWTGARDLIARTLHDAMTQRIPCTPEILTEICRRGLPLVMAMIRYRRGIGLNPLDDRGRLL